MAKNLLLVLLALSSLAAFGQHNWDSKNWDKRSLGFGCGYGGKMTRPVSSMTALLADKDYQQIREELYSKLPATQYLATFLVEKLSGEDELEISDAELKRIEEIKNSKAKVPVCSGCVYWDELTLKQLFAPNTKEIMSERAGYWFETHYKQKDSK